MDINYDGRKCASIKNSGTGEVGSETTFHYHQDGNIVWAEYSGGEIIRGHLIAVRDNDGVLDMRYHHINTKCEMMTGVCTSTPEILPDGRIRLHERWQWTCGDNSSGQSIVEEFFSKIS
jgi:hypothetical protein